MTLRSEIKWRYSQPQEVILQTLAGINDAITY